MSGRPSDRAGRKVGRPREGFKLRLPKGQQVWLVRFTHEGRRTERSTGERDREAAARAAERIYASLEGWPTDSCILPGQNNSSREKHSGWTPERFAWAWLTQAGRCEICNREMTPRGRSANSACADHGFGEQGAKVPRGLLCKICNTRLSPLEDVKFVRRATAYLGLYT